jgi:hypothetical protein
MSKLKPSKRPVTRAVVAHVAPAHFSKTAVYRTEGAASPNATYMDALILPSIESMMSIR